MTEKKQHPFEWVWLPGFRVFEWGGIYIWWGRWRWWL